MVRGKIMILAMACLAILAAIGCTATAEPVIHGVKGKFAHHSVATVTGSGFGRKPVPAPVRWDSFDDESRRPGDSVDSGGYWTGGSRGDITYSNTRSRHGNSRHHLRDRMVYSHPPTSRNDLFFRDDLFPGPGKFFLSFWLYIDFPHLKASDDWQLKVMRISAGNRHSDWPTFNLQSWWTPSGRSVKSYFEYPGPPLRSVYGQGVERGKWMRMQIEFQESDVDVPNGRIATVTVRDDGRIFRHEVSKVITRSARYPGHLKTAKFGSYITNNLKNDHEVHTYWDDIYIDNSWARIELGNDPAYHRCSRLEMQVPTAWSDSSVRFRVNAGAFEPGQRAYLFVIDDRGRASAGLPVTIQPADAAGPGGRGKGTSGPQSTMLPGDFP